MTDVWTKPRSGQPINPIGYSQLIDNFLDTNYQTFRTDKNFSAARRDQLVNHARAIVSLMWVPYTPYYDTKFILKSFRKERFVQAPIEQEELEAASLHHAVEAFQHNKNFSPASRVYAVWVQRNFIPMECLLGRGYLNGTPAWSPKERMIRFVRQVENQLKVPRHNPDGRTVEPFCSPVWPEDGIVSLP